MYFQSAYYPICETEGTSAKLGYLFCEFGPVRPAPVGGVWWLCLSVVSDIMAGGVVFCVLVSESLYLPVSCVFGVCVLLSFSVPVLPICV